jgi:anti-sigma factor RsiW
MNCGNWEERIALYAGGDLQAAEAAEVERHLGDCPGCQVFASGLKDSLEVLQGAHREPIAPAHFAAVRARVMAELEGARQPWWRKAWVYGLVAAAVALVLVLAPRPAAPVHPRQIAVRPVPPEVPAPAPVVAKVVHAARRRRSHPAVFHSDPGSPIVVKLLTDDPDVVIYWITDKSGE